MPDIRENSKWYPKAFELASKVGLPRLAIEIVKLMEWAYAEGYKASDQQHPRHEDMGR